MAEGKLIKALSGFFYVDDGSDVFSCRASRTLKRENRIPLVGDLVSFDITDPQSGYIRDILPEKNRLVRPPVANVDLIAVFASAAPPVTDLFLVDRITVLASRLGIDVLICMNKNDLCDGSEIAEIYRRIGFSTVCTSAETGEGIDLLRNMIIGKTVVFTGNSGVGKSSMLNRLLSGNVVETGSLSERLGRGKQTTRHCELFAIGDATFVMDTPGFSSFELTEVSEISTTELSLAFPEIQKYPGYCRFDDCTHRSEPGCRITTAVEANEICRSRYESYLKLYQQISDLKKQS